MPPRVQASGGQLTYLTAVLLSDFKTAGLGTPYPFHSKSGARVVGTRAMAVGVVGGLLRPASAPRLFDGERSAKSSRPPTVRVRPGTTCVANNHNPNHNINNKSRRSKSFIILPADGFEGRGGNGGREATRGSQ